MITINTTLDKILDLPSIAYEKGLVDVWEETFEGYTGRLDRAETMVDFVDEIVGVAKIDDEELLIAVLAEIEGAHQVLYLGSGGEHEVSIDMEATIDNGNLCVRILG